MFFGSFCFLYLGKSIANIYKDSKKKTELEKDVKEAHEFYKAKGLNFEK